MLRYALARAALAVAVVFTVTLVAFVLTEVVVDPAAGLAGPDATAAEIEQVRVQFGLDRPAPQRYLTWLGRLAHGDLGNSLHYKQPVATLIADRLPVTVTLAFASMGIALLLALPLGIAASLAPGSWLDKAALLLAVTGQALPSFWTGLMLIVLFGVWLGWLPVSGTEDWTGYIMPSVTLGLFTLPVLLRLARAGMLDVLGTDYVRAARARGLRRRQVVLRHALRNAVMPLVAVGAVQLGYLLGGSIVTEQVFAMHGVGYLAWQAILIGDTAIIQAVVLLMALAYAALTLAADLLNAAFDPRLRLS